MDKLIYNKSILVARVDEFNHLSWVCKECAPLYLQVTENFLGWLQGRCVDSHRKNSRLLKRALRISEKDDEEIVLQVNAATVTDTYWIKDEGSTLTWEQVDFKKAEFSGLALIGTYNHYYRAEQAKTKKTPELTNIGSFEKCWRVRDGEWWLYKEGNPNELFSELFAYKLGKALGFNMAEYKLGSRYIKPGTRCILSRDFTQSHKYNFEPIVALVGDSPDDYKRTYQKIYNVSPEAASDYISLLFMDALIFNPDRHEYNFGLLSNPDTGNIVGLAPNFDNNMALISRGYPPESQRHTDALIKDFNQLLDSGVQWIGYSQYKRLPVINEALIRSIIKDIGLKVRENFIVDFIMSSYKAIGWDKSMTIEKILKTVQAREYPHLIASANADDSKALQLIKEEVFYISPALEIVHEDDRPQVMIFSAAGATGKSALAKYLAKNFKCIYWDLAKTSVGENSFYGKLDKILGRKNVDDFQTQMGEGTTALIIDAFDEAEIRRGRADIQLFLNDIIEFVHEFKTPSMILFSRSENARFLNEYLRNNGVRIVHYQIGLIDENNGKLFIERLLQKKKRKVTTVTKIAIAQEFNSISEFLGDDAKAFLGYAPVLEALTELVFQERNTINLVKKLEQGANADIVFKKIMWDLLEREQQKFVEQIRREWEVKCPTFSEWHKVYSIDEQIYDVLSFACLDDLVEHISSQDIPDELKQDYEDAVMRFLPSHPFIHQNDNGGFDFSGPAFRDFAIVYGILSDSDIVRAIAMDVLEQQEKSSPLLAEFYSAMNNIRNGELSEEKTIDKEVFPYIYDSCKASVRSNETTRLVINSSGETCYAMVSTHVGQNPKLLSVEFACGTSSEAEEPSLILPSLENATIWFPGKVIIQEVTHKQVDAPEISIENVYINANIIEFKAKRILFTNAPGTKTLMEARERIIVDTSTLVSVAQESALSLCAPNINRDHRLRKFYSSSVVDKSEGLLPFSHAISSICLQFNFGKSRTISIIEKLFLRDPSSNKAKVFRFLMSKKCITSDGLDYTLNLMKMSELNINWSPTAQNEMTMYEDAYLQYCNWLDKDITNGIVK